MSYIKIINPSTYTENVEYVNTEILKTSGSGRNFIAKGHISIQLTNGQWIEATGEFGQNDYEHLGFRIESVRSICDLYGAVETDGWIIIDFKEEVSNNGGEDITLHDAIKVEEEMLEMGFGYGSIGSSLNVLRFKIKN